MTILHMCTKNENHIMYGSWEIECDRHNFCYFGPFNALLLTPLTIHKIKILKKNEKNPQKNKYSCSGPPIFKSGSYRLRFSQLFLRYK